MRDPGAGRERRRHRHRRRARLRVQDGEPQPPELHRALSGRGDRRRRHPARRLHHGRAADRLPQRAVASAIPTHPKTRHLVSGVVAGIGGYGNSFGVPTVGGSVRFHARYDGNILVNAMAVGIAENGQDLLRGGLRRRHADRLSRLQDRPRRHPRRHRWPRPNSTRTPRRSARPCRSAIRSPKSCCSKPASRSWRRAASSPSRTWARPASPARRSRWAPRAISASRSISTRCRAAKTGMSAYEMMLSESQERMLMVLKPEKEEEAEAIFRKWGLDFAIVGETTPTKRFIVRHGGEVMADLPIKELGDEAPEYERPFVDAAEAAGASTPRRVTPPMAIADALVKLIGSPDLCSKRWVWEQYDHIILGNTVQRPGGDAAVVRIEDGPKGAGAHHRRDAALLRGRSVRGRQAGGGRMLAQPHRGRRRAARRHRQSQFRQSGAAGDHGPVGRLHPRHRARPAGRSTFPVVSGNVSLYNETNGRAILPTPTIGGVGAARRFHQVGDARLQARGRGDPADRRDHTAGSASRSICARSAGARRARRRRSISIEERENGDFVRALILDGIATAVHDCPTAGSRWRSPRWRWRPGIGAELDARARRYRRRMPSGSARIRRAIVVTCRRQAPRRCLAARARGRRAGTPDRHHRRRCADAAGRARACRSPSCASASKAGCRPIWRAKCPPRYSALAQR